MFFGNHEASANARGRKKVLAKVGHRIRDLSEAGKAGQDPLVVDLPAVLGLQRVHHAVPVATAGVAAQVGAAAECTQYEERRVLACRSNHESCGEHIIFAHWKIMVRAYLECFGIEVTAEGVPIEARVGLPQPATAREVLVITAVDLQRNRDGAYVESQGRIKELVRVFGRQPQTGVDVATEVAKARVKPSEETPSHLGEVGGPLLEDVDTDSPVTLITAQAVETVADVGVTATGGHAQPVVQEVELDADAIDIAAVLGNETVGAQNRRRHLGILVFWRQEVADGHGEVPAHLRRAARHRGHDEIGWPVCHQAAQRIACYPRVIDANVHDRAKLVSF